MPGRIIHHGAKSENECKYQEHPWRNQSLEREHAKQSGSYDHPGLSDEEEAPPVN